VGKHAESLFFSGGVFANPLRLVEALVRGGRRNFHGEGLLVGPIVVEELPSTVIELSGFVLVNIPQKKCGKFTLPLVEQRKGLR
jgi:hypothetical protein